MNWEDFEDPTQLIKTAIKVFRYDNVLTDCGWPHDVYYDRKAEGFIVDDFPTKGQVFELPVRPENGPGEIGINDDIYKVKIYEE